ncbi:glycine cleavage system aminomethyltransferase GcvT [Novosphingobium sp. NBM11]|uniref:glycine cleavage system aminomethyltransferase GcvT n=1 Tax=Novosphingobium sp. NBM11 TaxID=2596914 RepID=UPI0018926CD0|nr:glycine cleavage system aminomethyltransferase GcvT [Novosphingobium sp. NBM11]MBF5092102.1 glycine cleavage system aminomethyltransferase GcvT [Novosphingobium sp. NBM11]
MSDTYKISPHETGEPDAGPLALPLDAWHRARGGRMVAFAGYWMPVQYEGIIAEHLWTRAQAGFFDVSHMGQLYITGEHAEAAIEAVLPIDLSTLPLGGVRYSLLLDANGGILDDLMVTRWGTGFYLVVNGATKHDDIAHLRANLPEAVSLTHLADSALFALQGPEAFAALAPLVGGEHALSALSFMRGASFTLGGVDAWISRSGYTGEDGFEIAVPAESAAAIADLICAQPQVKPIGLGARDSLRLEAGLPLYGHDMTPDVDPVSADLLFGINKRRRGDGGFPGADRILPLIDTGSVTRRVGLVLEGRMAAREGAKVLWGEAEVGSVTSGGFSPSLEKPIAMATVAAELARPGTQLIIDVRGRKIAATVTPMPFVPHRYHRKGAA